MTVSSMIDLLPSLKEPGKRLVDAGELYEAFAMLFGANTGVVGAASAPGPILNSAVNLILHGPNVALPPAIPGRQIYVGNDSTSGTTLTVNAQPGNTVDGAATATLAAGDLAMYLCLAPGKWIEISVTTGGPVSASATIPTSEPEPAAEAPRRRRA